MADGYDEEGAYEEEEEEEESWAEGSLMSGPEPVSSSRGVTRASELCCVVLSCVLDSWIESR